MLFRVEPFNIGRNVALMVGLGGDGFWASHFDLWRAAISVLALGLVVAAAHSVQTIAKGGRELERIIASPYATGAVFGVLLLFVFLFGSLLENLPFIYFQF